MASIVVDSREPPKWREVGDEVEDILVDFLIVGEHRRYAVERKTVSDLWKSVQSGRLWKQLERLLILAEDGYTPILLVVGNPYRLVKSKKVKMTFPQYYAILSSVIEMGVGVVQVQNDEQAKLYLHTLDSRAGKPPNGWRRPHIPRKQGRTVEEEAVDVLSMITGVGPATAKKMLEEIGSVRDIADSSPEELSRVVGEKKAGRIKDVLNYRVSRDN